MKQRIAVMVLVMLLPVIALAQTPVPTPPAAPPAFDETQAPVPRQSGQAPQPPQPMQRDLGKWWKNSEVVQDLQLTDEQIAKIEQTFFEHRLKLIDLKADVERNEAKLQPLIEADRPDEAKVGAQIDLLLAARGKLEKENAMMMLAIRRVLSVEQWKKLEAIQQGRERMRMKMPGPGSGQMKMRQPMPAPPASTPPPPRPPDPAID